MHFHPDEAAADIAREGVHQIGLPGGQILEFCVQGLDSLGANAGPPAALVCFSGAVGNRKGKTPPFFSGLGIAKGLGLPLVAVSDPTLAVNDTLPLGWYAGNENLPGLPRQIAAVLDAFAAKTGTRLILFGGSGGGFAAISHLGLLRADAAGFVWNPQTSIGGYGFSFVLQYLSAAFPSLAGQVEAVRALPKAGQREALRALLDAAGLRHDLTADAPDHGRRPLLYLQNRDDWHVGQHARPYLTRTPGWRRLSAQAFADAEGLTACWFGMWGHGHAVPPYDMIKAVLASLAGGDSVAEIALRLDREAAAQGEPEPFAWFDGQALDG